MEGFFGSSLGFEDEHVIQYYDFQLVSPLHLYVFEETPKISTYLFALAAGAYKVCKDKLMDERFPPFRLLMRNNLKSPLSVEEVSIMFK
jgi:hypothetical protein